MDIISTQAKVSEPAQTSVSQEWLRLLWYWLGRRRVLIALAVAAVAGGAVLNWSWLVAIGLAPIILAVLPCAAMCAIGLCAMGRSNPACGDDAKREEARDSDVRSAATGAQKRERVPDSE